MMNKEEKPILYTNLEWEDVLDYNHTTWISIDRFKHLQQKNDDLQARIDKAMEYINDLSLDFYDYECEQLIVGKHMINELLEILGGKRMKIIEALTECANGKNFENCKMKYKEMEFERFNEYEIYDDLYEEKITLNDEIEIIEEVEDKEYEEIKELGEWGIYTDGKRGSIIDIEEIRDKIDALIRNQQKIIEVLNELKENN